MSNNTTPAAPRWITAYAAGGGSVRHIVQVTGDWYGAYAAAAVCGVSPRIRWTNTRWIVTDERAGYDTPAAAIEGKGNVCKRCSAAAARLDAAAHTEDTPAPAPAESLEENKMTHPIIEASKAAAKRRLQSQFSMSFPALDGGIVMQGHADYCRDNGHATHTVSGVVAEHCPRCGDRVTPAPEDTTPAPAKVSRRRQAEIAAGFMPELTPAAPALEDTTPAPLYVGQYVIVEGHHTGKITALQPAADSISGVDVARVKLDSYGNSGWFDAVKVAPAPRVPVAVPAAALTPGVTLTGYVGGDPVTGVAAVVPAAGDTWTHTVITWITAGGVQFDETVKNDYPVYTLQDVTPLTVKPEDTRAGAIVAGDRSGAYARVLDYTYSPTRVTVDTVRVQVTGGTSHPARVAVAHDALDTLQAALGDVPVSISTYEATGQWDGAVMFTFGGN